MQLAFSSNVHVQFDSAGQNLIETRGKLRLLVCKSVCTNKVCADKTVSHEFLII